MPYADPEKKNKHNKQYYKKNRRKILQDKKEWYETIGRDLMKAKRDQEKIN